MSDQRQRRARAIFNACQRLDTSHQRSELVKQECAGDEELESAVFRLLEAQDANSSFLERPLDNQLARSSAPMSDTVDQAVTKSSETVIGPYKLLQQIGEGGFGAVYMAEQAKPVERRVALKIIKPGMDTRDVIARFESERQALALMDHPNVAKVFDAGATDSGRPYFVMELVHGIPITEFCDKNSLSTRQRLEMFIDVCRAVQHAHQKGIIHRDIKPSNIMVTLHDGKPVPKVIDFGVAKATSQKLTERTLFTAYGQMIGTPTYMSPEQAEMSGLGIDTRSDIYSLGVLLYELLTGMTPLDPTRLRATGYAELQRIIREEVPPTPSRKLSTLGELATIVAQHRRTEVGKLSQLLRGELDWIVMKALEKERDRRYESASNFAADVERFLNDEAVAACPPSTAYRFRKFVRRNRGSVIAATALLLMLCLGLTGTSLGLYRARVAEANARTAETDARSDRDTAVVAQAAERRLNFHLAFDRGLALCEQGSVARGMLWLTRALELAPSDETGMRRVILANLNAWRRELPTLEAIFSHSHMLACASFSPDGTQVITGSADKSARLWDIATGRPQPIVLMHEGDVHEALFSADGTRILTANYDRTARLWDARNGELLFVLPHQGLVPGGAFSPDASWFVTGSGDGAVTLWNTASGQPFGKLRHGHMVHDVAVSNDGTKILTASHDMTARLWDSSTHELIATFKHDTRVHTADFRRPDCTEVVTGAADGSVYLWDVDAAMSDDDKRLETAAEEFVGGPWRHRGTVHRLRVSPDGTRILTASFDNTARFWNPDEASGASTFDHQGAVQGVAFSPDGARVLTACEDNAARLWAPALGQSVRKVQHAVLGDNEAVYTADGRYVLIKDDDHVKLHDALTGSPLGQPIRELGGIRAVAVSPDGSTILTGGTRGRLWDAATGEPLCKPFQEGDIIWSVAFSFDGARALCSTYAGGLQLRDVQTGNPLGHPLELGSRAHAVAFSPDDSRIVVTSNDKVARIFDANMGNIPRPLIGHHSTVNTVAFSPDGKYIVTGSWDNTARVWVAKTGKPLSDPMIHQGPIWHGTAFSPDGRTVVTGCEDQTVRIWDAATAQPIGPALTHESGVRMAAFSGDGSHVRTGTALGTVRIWHASISPLEGNFKRIKIWLEVVTGMELDADSGEMSVLDVATWHQRREHLRALGGPPTGSS